MVQELADWERITPEKLVPAVKHIRKTFDRSAWICSEVTEKLCYSALHPQEADVVALAPYLANFKDYRAILGRAAQREFDELLRMEIPPALFHAFLDAFCKGLKNEVQRVFNDVFQIGLSNSEALKMHPVEWAKSHLRMLIAHNSHLVGLWIKSACDKQATWKPIDTEDASEDFIYWKTWRAPRFVHMQPCGHTLYDPASAWTREDKTETEKLLKGLSGRFVMSLEFALDKAAGDAHVEYVKKSDAKMQHGHAEGAVSKPEFWRDLRNQFESLAREEREGRAGQSDRYLRAYCNYKDHPEVIEKGKTEQGPFCLIEKPECGLWMLSDGISENFRERFDVLATRAGIALGTPRNEASLDFWLHRLYRNMLENKSSELFAADEIGGIILRVCETSATFCSRLERMALETPAHAPLRITSINLVDPSLVKLGLVDFSLHRLDEVSTEHLLKLLAEAEERLFRLRRANPDRQAGAVGAEAEADQLMAQTVALVKQIKTALVLRDALPADPTSREREAIVTPILQQKGWSVLDWASNSDVDYHTANHYLKGKTTPYKSTLKKLADSLGIDVQKLPS